MSKQSDLVNITQGDTLYVDHTSGNVGIGTSSPSANLDVASSNATIHLTDTDDTTYAEIRNNGGTFTIASDEGAAASNSSINFRVDGTEAMRIDSSGNLLVGKTVNNNTTTGIKLDSQGYISASIPNDYPLILNRQTSDGPIAMFRKDGSTVGSILSRSSLVLSIVFDPRTNGSGITGSTLKILPTDKDGQNLDNAVDLGSTATRWDDIYATNGTIQTSDQNEKQQIAALTDAEITAAKAISKLFKTFKWNDSVAEKGDAARTHSGVIAQEVEQAMTDAGLNAGDYAFFISTTWWETQTEVPAVEADEENGVEAQEAYTRTDTYDTLEEAPEGATERNRKGIRYPQLLSFIGAATEQRLASIESRLDALETV